MSAIALVGVSDGTDEDDLAEDTPLEVDAIPEGVSDPVDLLSLPAPEDYTSPAALQAYDAETCRVISDYRDELYEHLTALNTAKARAKAAKDRYAVCLDNMLERISERQRQRGQKPQPTLYPEPPAPAAKKAEPAKPVEVNPQSDAWKAIPLMDLASKDGLPGKTVAILLDNGISTLGELAAYQEPGPSGFTKKLTDLKGFGPAKLEQVEAATAKFWERWAKDGNATPPSDGGESAGSSEPATETEGARLEDYVGPTEKLPD